MKLFQAVEKPPKTWGQEGNEDIQMGWRSEGGKAVEVSGSDESQVRDLRLRSKTHWDWLSMGHSEKTDQQRGRLVEGCCL